MYNFTEQEINLILSGLAELQAKYSFDLINKIHVQFNENKNKIKE